MAPVQVGLLEEVRVIVILARQRVSRPRAAAEDASPVVRRSAARRRIAPDVPISPRRVPGQARVREPGMPVRGVVRDVVEDDLEPTPMGLVEERVEVGEGAEPRIDGAVVGDVVAEVGHRRGIDRRDPERVHAEPLEVGEALRDAGQVADAVAVRVQERARVDLVDHASLPPRAGRHPRSSKKTRRGRTRRRSMSRMAYE